MVNYREILRLNSLKYSQRQIAASVHSSRDTVSEVIKLAKQHELNWPLEEAATNEFLSSVFYPDRITQSDRKELDFSYLHHELAKQGVTMTLLWSEYCEKTYSSNLKPYMYSQFCDKYRDWAKLTKATMRIKHKPGDAMEVDWAGNTLSIYDSTTGEPTIAYLFVAVLPCSCYVYVELCPDMKSETWIMCHVHAYHYFGGVTRLLIPDNLKTGIIKNTRYETVFNRSYNEMAEYYKTAIVPARVSHPQDKSHAEGTVKFASTWIIAALRSRKFFSMTEATTAVKEKLEELNNYSFKKREGNRRNAYFDEEKAFMKPLPAIPYEPAVWSTATIQHDYLITDGKNKYSVPYDLIGETVDIRITRFVVEAFFHGNRVASHPRIQKIQREPIVLPEHMTEEHRRYLSYNADDFTVWASGIGKNTKTVVNSFLKTGLAPEQGYKACASLTKLADKYGLERLEHSCERAIIYSSSPTVRIISSILKNGQDKVEKGTSTAKNLKASLFGITRGADYFAKGGVSND